MTKQMTRYIVVLTRTEIDHDATETLGEEVTTVENDVVLCDSTQEVFGTLRDARKTDNVDWAVFEVVDGKKGQRRAVTKRRAVLFLYDGSRPYDVTIS